MIPTRNATQNSREAYQAVYRWLLPWAGTIYDLESAMRAGRRAAKVAYFCAGLILIEVSCPPTATDLRAYADGALVAGLAFGTWKMSRTCAVSALLMFIVNIALKSSGWGYSNNWLGSPVVHFSTGVGLVLQILFLALLLASFVEGVRATFAYHSCHNRRASLLLQGERTLASQARQSR